MRRLIVNADDFGLAPSVNEGIVDAHAAGCVTSATLMVNGQAAEAAAAMAGRHPELAVGLHFNLTLGNPTCSPGAVPSLVDREGRFHSRDALARRLVTGGVRQEHLELELQAQFDRLRDMGVAPTHVDSHQHVHGFPPVFDGVARLCCRMNLPMRVPWVLRVQGRGAGMGRRIRQAVLRAMLARCVLRWQEKVRWNDGLCSIFDLGVPARELELRHYREVLSRAPGRVVELMVHPARDARQLEGLTRIGDVSEAEWRLLQGADWRRMTEELGFAPATFRSAFP